jgi:hypothetical protein
MKKLIHRILRHKILQEKPPVLIDIGASGNIHAAWKTIARYSICIAFDADTRDFEVSETTGLGYSKLYTINRVVTAETQNETDFYLTHSPHCSSGLEPDAQRLIPWAFRNLFTIENKVKLPSITLEQALSRCGVDYVDWYKSDSQGTDLRLFNSLPLEIRNNIIAAEFEPGILDSYKNEDKLFSLMLYMDALPFWVADMQLKGSQRINENDLVRLSKYKQRFLRFFLRTPPGWCEIAYLNELQTAPSERDLLLGWVISTIKQEHGFAMNLARQGIVFTTNDLFKAMYQSSAASIGCIKSYFKLANSFLKTSCKRALF